MTPPPAYTIKLDTNTPTPTLKHLDEALLGEDLEEYEEEIELYRTYGGD